MSEGEGVEVRERPSRPWTPDAPHLPDAPRPIGALPAEGFFFSLEDLLAVFPRLKSQEAVLEADERTVLRKIEKILYEYLSVSEIEKHLANMEL